MKRRVLQVFVTSAVLVFFGWYIAGNYEHFSDLRLIRPWLLVPAFALTLVNLYGIGALMSASLEPLHVRLGWHESLGLAALNRLCNYISFAGLGAAVRAVYLKRRYNLSFATFSSSFAISNIVLLLYSGLLALLSLATAERHGTGGIEFMALLAVVVLLLTGMMVLPLGLTQRWLSKVRVRYPYKLLERLQAALAGFIRIRAWPALFSRMSLLAVASVLAVALTNFLLYRALGYPIDVLSALFITATSSWGIVIALTPANIGIREGLMAVAASLVAVPIPETLAVALLLRLIVFVVAVSLSSYYAPRLLHVSLTEIGKLGK